MEWKPEHNTVQLLAMKHTATALLGALAARHAAELAHRHGVAVPDAAINKAVERYASLLRTAIGFTQERRREVEEDE